MIAGEISFARGDEGYGHADAGVCSCKVLSGYFKRLRRLRSHKSIPSRLISFIRAVRSR